MSEKILEIDSVKLAKWLGLDAKDLSAYATAWYFLELHAQGKFPLKPGDKAKLEAIVEKLKPLIEPAIQKVKGEELVEVKAVFWLPQKLVRLIEEENYFSYGPNNKDQFYADSVRCLLSCITTEQPELEKKYGLKMDDTATSY